MEKKQKGELTKTLLVMFPLFAFVCYLASLSFPFRMVMLVAGIGETIIALALVYLVMFAKTTDGDATDDDA